MIDSEEEVLSGNPPLSVYNLEPGHKAKVAIQ